ncbi:MAG: DNA mismatch repair endonuclease MutL [Candidatus Omnitrophica bacterium]|nr:DNA mismatch repair endonuclease MutL [Candidatus Omnitrophota bacterium]
MENKKVHVLSDEVIGKIAAGEVVERPASVVKELVENSLDAGAKSVMIDLEAAGQGLIRVSDDGQGMTEEDAMLACEHHATSKISAITDLDSLATFGFRGEALSSIASVSHLLLTTRTRDSDSGVSIQVESGKVREVKPAARAHGTTVEVRNLFFNVPARKKFLKSDSTELSEIINVTGRFALSYPEAEFKLSHGGRVILHAASGLDQIGRIRLVMGQDVAEGMMPISYRSGKLSMTGYISKPSVTRKDRYSQVLFVNKRFVRSKSITDAVMDAYSSLLERGRYPAVALFLEVPASEVDVNVHPAKLLVKFSEEKMIKTHVYDSIVHAFSVLKRETGGQDTTLEENTFGSTLGLPGGMAPSQRLQTQASFEYAVEPERTAFLGGGLKVGWEGAPRGFTHEGEPLFQVGKCFIVRIKDNGLGIIDQHAAHERIFYEYFSNAVRSGSKEAQNLLFPVRLDLTARDAEVMETATEAFCALGFKIEHFGDRSYVVQTVPAILNDADIKSVIMDALGDLSSRVGRKIDHIDEMIKIMACRAAVKAGDELSEHEMNSILEQLKKCDLPFTCPHGRPTVIEISVEDMEKMFRRN